MTSLGNSKKERWKRQAVMASWKRQLEDDERFEHQRLQSGAAREPLLVCDTVLVDADKILERLKDFGRLSDVKTTLEAMDVEGFQCLTHLTQFSLGPSKNALRIPEILARVGHFIPLWVVDEDRHNRNMGTTLKPSTTRACLLVSKLWYQTFLPILWHTYICPQMRHVPLQVIQRHSPHFRIFDSYSGHPGPFFCTNLVELTLRRQVHLPGEHISLETERDLIRANPNIKSLFWFGPRPQVALDARDFVGLEVVENVHLHHWIGSGGGLARTLKTLARSMVSLELLWIFGLSANDFLDPDDGSDEAIARSMSDQDIDIAPTFAPGQRLVLPLITKLTCTLRYEGFRELQGIIGCCPNVVELVINPDIYVDFDRIARDIQTNCRKVRALTLQHLPLHSSHCEQLVSSCRASGLVKLEVLLRGMDESLVLAILAHANTLQALTISLQSFEHPTSHGLMQLLGHCVQLKKLRMTFNFPPPTGTVLEALRSGPWGCLMLETLQLVTRTQPADGEPDRVGDRDEEEDIEALKGMTSGQAAMGWYRRNVDKDAWAGELDVDLTSLRKVLKMVEPLQQLKSLTWNCSELHRP
ncbi:hypothetical protein BGX24_002081 [Mortierella sp. AD032]|nr:hypothetical protein BGX24_002081 [Mortierella sp. AD032]